MKKILAISFIALMMTACGGGPKNESNQNTLASDEPVMVTVGNFKDMAPNLVGKLVTITGTADHICKSDGKKLFLISTESEGRVKVVSGDELLPFNKEHEGLDFIVTGIVEEDIVDEAYLQEWEEEIKAGIEEKKHLGGGEPLTPEEIAAGHHIDDPATEQIANYRKKMAEKGVTKLSFFSIIATSYELLEN